MAEYALHTWNGRVWRFNDPTCPLSLHRDPTGLEGAAFTPDDQTNVGQAGVTFKARDDAPNLIGLDVKVGPLDPGEQAVWWLKDWRHSLGRMIHLHTFHAHTPWGGDRFQRVRLAEKLAPPNLYQMRHSGVILHDEVVLRSDESWWRKTPVVKTFDPADFVSASVVSESEEDVWPHIVITGPITAPVIGWGTDNTVPLGDIPAGDTVTIDTDPDWWQITNSAGDDLSWVGDRWYQPIPAVDPGPQTVPIVIQGTATTAATSVTFTVPQLFWEGY